MPLPGRSFPQKAAGPSQPSQLVGLRRDIDIFLDTSQVGQVGYTERLEPGPAEDASPVVSQGLSFSQIQHLSDNNEELQRALEGARQEVKAKSKAISTFSSTQRSQLSNAKKECSELREDGRAKKRRISEMEDEIVKLQRERDKLATDLKEFRDRSQRDMQAMELKASEERRKQDCAIAHLESRLQQLSEASRSGSGHEPLKARNSELEQEILALRLLLKEWWPEKELATQLQVKHLELDQELQQLRSARTDLLSAREQVKTLEKGQASLKADLDARDAALKEAREADVANSLAKQDLLAFQDVALEILNAARECRSDVPVSATAANLRSAWSFLQARLAKETQKSQQTQRQLDAAVDEQKDLEIKISKLRVEAVCSADLKGQLQHARSEIQRLTSEASMLQEALAGKSPDFEKLPPRTAESQELQQQLAAKQHAIDSITKEADSLRSQIGKLMDIEGKARKLERVNSELWEANRDLESRLERLEAADLQDFDPRTTKVLHLARGPTGHDAPSAGVDLEQQQASRQLDRFKKAMRKYVQEFREGIYHLLGWKVEMKGDSTSMRFHLTSRYHEGQELVFQLRPASIGHAAEFDLLGTSWAEQLQGDRQAMAFLEVYSSIPGFLAHVTVDRLAQQTFTR